MSSYAGFQTPSLTGGAPAESARSILEWPGITAFSMPTPAPVNGSHHSSQPTAAVPDAHGGVYVGSYLDLIADQVHLSPIHIDCGNIVGEQVHTVSLWNTHAAPVTCAALTSAQGGEVELIGPEAPFAIPALGEATYTVRVPLDGAAGFETRLTWEFPGAAVTLTMTGRRIVVWAWRPQQPIVESLEWLTRVRRTHAGAEQRTALRGAPRQGFEYATRLADEAEQAHMDARIWAWRSRVWCVPIWWELRRSAGAVHAGDAAVLVDTAHADFRAGGVAVLWGSDRRSEAVMVSGVTSGALDLAQPVQGDYPAGCLVLPGRMATLAEDPAHTERGAGLRDTRVRFAVTENAAIPGYAPELTYDGLPVLTQPPRLAGGTLPRTVHRDMDVVDYATGPVLLTSGWRHDVVDSAHGVRADSPAAVWALRQLLHHLRGRDRTVWAPTWKDDFHLLDPVGVDGVNLRVRGAHHSGYHLDPRRQHLAVLDHAGNIIAMRRIVGVAAAGADVDIVTIDAPVGRELHPGGARICYLIKSRLTADRVELTHHRAGVAEATLHFSGGVL